MVPHSRARGWTNVDEAKLIEAILTGLAEGTAIHAFDQSAGLSKSIWSWLQSRKQQHSSSEYEALQGAVRETYKQFDRDHPQYSASFFDEDFVADVIGRRLASLLVNPDVDVVSPLLNGWMERLGGSERQRYVRGEKLRGDIEEFASRLHMNMRYRPEFSTLWDSVAADTTARTMATIAGAFPELMEKVSEGIPVLQSILSAITSNGGGGTPLPSKIPNELPIALVEGFVGRDLAVGHMTKAIARPPESTSGALARLVVVTGMPAVGKSALALRVAVRQAGDFPDGQVYRNLRGATATDTDKYVASILDSFGLTPHTIPESRLAQYATALRDKRMLLFLDNAGDPALVEALIAPSPDSVTIVTSINAMTTIARSITVNVEKLGVEDSMLILNQSIGTQRSSAEPEPCVEVVGLCAGLPLAVRVTAARLAADPRRLLADEANELRMACQRPSLISFTLDNLNLAAAFALSVDALNPKEARLFRLLGLLPGPEMPQPFVEALDRDGLGGLRLAHLIGLHLVERPMAGRVGLHDLLRIYAVEELKGGRASVGNDEWNEGRARTVDWYTAALTVVNDLLQRGAAASPPPTSPAEQPVGKSLNWRHAALLWMDAECANALVALDLAAEIGKDANVWHMAASLADYLDIRGAWDIWEKIQDKAIAAATRAEDHSARAFSLMNLGNALLRRGRLPDANQAFEAALQIYRALAERAGEMRTLQGQATLAALEGKTQRALDLWNDALSIARAEGDVRTEAQIVMNRMAHINLHNAAVSVDDSASSADLDTVIAILTRSDDSRLLSGALHNRAVVHTRQEKWAEAEADFVAAAATAAEIGDKAQQTKVLIDLGQLWVAQGKFSKALDLYNLVQSDAKSAGDKEILADLYLAQGIALAQQADSADALAGDDAERLLAAACAAYHALSRPIDEGRALGTIAALRMIRGDRAGAIDAGRNALTLVQSNETVRARIEQLLREIGS